MAHHDHSDSQSQDIFKRQMISTGVDHLPFGTGKHACPVSISSICTRPCSPFDDYQGRFFAATELKAIMAHVVINYDVKAEVEGVRPPDDVFGTRISPNPVGRVQFRKRQ
jgi:cytochrome P450